MKTENRVAISAGSNINPILNMYIAIEKIKKHFQIISVSSFETTKPIGITNQPDFLNGVILVSTTLSILEVKTILKQIEDDMGRNRNLPKFGPRNIDLDLLIWNELVVDEDYYSRNFLQKAIAQLGITPSRELPPDLLQN